VDTLHSSIKEFDAEAYRIAKEAFKAADEFSIKLDLSETLIKNVLSACLLYCFTPEYLAEMFPETEFPRIVKDGKRLLSEEISFDDEPSIGSQVFAAAVSYAQNEGNLDTVISNPKIDSIRQEFISFMEEKQVVEQELTLEPESSHTTRSQSVGGTIKNHLNLSNREKEVLELVIQGLNNKEIAQELYISEHTVKNHLTKIFQKLNVPDRTQAISKVYQLTYNKSAKP
jgi:ATP/maltotriose-dependent transcriptional regulator MalT